MATDSDQIEWLVVLVLQVCVCVSVCKDNLDTNRCFDNLSTVFAQL